MLLQGLSGDLLFDEHSDGRLLQVPAAASRDSTVVRARPCFGRRTKRQPPLVPHSGLHERCAPGGSAACQAATAGEATIPTPSGREWGSPGAVRMTCRRRVCSRRRSGHGCREEKNDAPMTAAHEPRRNAVPIRVVESGAWNEESPGPAEAEPDYV